AEPAAHVVDEPAAELWIVRLRRRPLREQAVEELGATPPVPNLSQALAPLAVGQRPWVVLGPTPFRGRIEEHEPRRPLGRGGREERRQPRTLLRRPEHGR